MLQRVRMKFCVILLCRRIWLPTLIGYCSTAHPRAELNLTQRKLCLHSFGILVDFYPGTISFTTISILFFIKIFTKYFRWNSHDEMFTLKITSLCGKNVYGHIDDSDFHVKKIVQLQQKIGQDEPNVLCGQRNRPNWSGKFRRMLWLNDWVCNGTRLFGRKTASTTVKLITPWKLVRSIICKYIIIAGWAE